MVSQFYAGDVGEITIVHRLQGCRVMVEPCEDEKNARAWCLPVRMVSCPLLWSNDGRALIESGNDEQYLRSAANATRSQLDTPALGCTCLSNR
jgi:hypothetical protein